MCVYTVCVCSVRCARTQQNVDDECINIEYKFKVREGEKVKNKINNPYMQ